jgi:hypothetical protein
MTLNNLRKFAKPLTRCEMMNIAGGAYATVTCKKGENESGMSSFSGPVASFEEAESLAAQYCKNGYSSIMVVGE